MLSTNGYGGAARLHVYCVTLIRPNSISDVPCGDRAGEVFAGAAGPMSAVIVLG